MLFRTSFVEPRFKDFFFIQQKENRVSAHAKAYKDVLEQMRQLPAPPPVVNNAANNNTDNYQNPIASIFGQAQNRSNAIIYDGVEAELDEYLAVKVRDVEHLNPLKWWKEHESAFPRVACVAKKWLACPATSTPCERLWSTAGLVVDERRTRLSANQVERMTFLAHNESFFDN